MPDFPQFSRLPPDLRQEIWREASSFPSSAAGVCILRMASPAVWTLAERPPRTHGPLVVHEPVNINLLATNTEAYDIALRSAGGTHEYDPARDILYLDSRTTFEYFVGVICGREPDPWTADVRHLAVALNMADRGLWLPNALTWLASLETLSIVYPAASGIFDCHATVPPPENPGALLHLLTKEERAGLTITANYLYETHGGDVPVVWTKKADEHLSMIEEHLVMYCAPDWRGGRCPIWDGATKRLKLKYQARVFKSLTLKPYGPGQEDHVGDAERRL